MSTIAKIMMLSAQFTVTAFTVYFFIRVLTAKTKNEPDSYSENNDEVR